MPTSARYKSLLTHNTKVYGIMGGLPSRRNMRFSAMNRATSRLTIPSNPYLGLRYMRMHNLLSKNPQCSGGVGRVNNVGCHSGSKYYNVPTTESSLGSAAESSLGTAAESPPTLPSESPSTPPRQLTLSRPISDTIVIPCPWPSSQLIWTVTSEEFYCCRSPPCNISKDNLANICCPGDKCPDGVPLCPPQPGCPGAEREPFGMVGYKNRNAWICTPQSGYDGSSGCSVYKTPAGTTTCNLSTPDVSGYCPNLEYCDTLQSECDYTTGECSYGPGTSNYKYCKDSCKQIIDCSCIFDTGEIYTKDNTLDFGTLLFPGYSGYISATGAYKDNKDNVVKHQLMTCDCVKNQLIPYKDPITCVGTLPLLLNSIEGGSGTWVNSATTKFVAYETNSTSNFYASETADPNKNSTPGNLTIHNRYFFPNGRAYFDNSKNDIKWISNFYSLVNNINDNPFPDTPNNTTGHSLNIWVRGIKTSGFNAPMSMLHPYFFYGVPGNEPSYNNINNLGLHHSDINFGLDMELNNFPSIGPSEILPVKFPVDNIDSSAAALMYRNIYIYSSETERKRYTVPYLPSADNKIEIDNLDSDLIYPAISMGHYPTGSIPSDGSNIPKGKNMITYDSRVWNFAEPKTCGYTNGIVECNQWQYGGPGSFIVARLPAHRVSYKYNTNKDLFTTLLEWVDPPDNKKVLGQPSIFGCDASGLSGLRCWNARLGPRHVGAGWPPLCDEFWNGKFIVNPNSSSEQPMESSISGPLLESEMGIESVDISDNNFGAFTPYSSPVDISCAYSDLGCAMYMPTDVVYWKGGSSVIRRDQLQPALLPKSYPECPTECLTCRSGSTSGGAALNNGICTEHCNKDGTCSSKASSGSVACSTCNPEVNGYAKLANIHQVTPHPDMSAGYVPIQCAPWDTSAIAWHTTFSKADASLAELDPNAWGIYYKWVKFIDQPGFANIPDSEFAPGDKKTWQSAIVQLHKDMDAGKVNFGYGIPFVPE